MTESDRPAFVRAIGRLAVALREKKPDVVQLRVYFDGLNDLEVEFVVAAVERLMRAAWFPKVSDWREAAQRVERERCEQQAARLRRLPQPLCDACSDTGWALSENGATRCRCVAQRRRELLGRASPPVALFDSDGDAA